MSREVRVIIRRYTFYSESMSGLSKKKLKIVRCSRGVMYVGEVFNDKCHGRGTNKIIQVLLYLKMGDSTKVNSKITSVKAKVSTSKLTVPGTSASSQTTRKMVAA